MLKNKRGFTMVELLAMIVITSAIIFPLLTSLIDSFKVNDIMHDRKSAVTITETTIYAFGKLSFQDLSNKIDDANTAGTYFVELDQSTCSNLLYPEDQTLCVKIFDTIWNNLSFNDTTFKVYIYDYTLSQSQINSLSSNTDIPVDVRDDIVLLTEETIIYDDLIRISVWIQYDESSFGITTQTALIANE